MSAWAGLIEDPRVAILVAAVPSIVPGVWVYWQWRTKLADDHEIRELSREERRIQDLDKLQASLNNGQWRLLEGVRKENDKLVQENEDLRRDRDRGWDLARFWHGTARDLLAQFRELRHTAIAMQQWIQSAVRQMRGYLGPDGEPILKPPEAIEPVPDLPVVPMGVEDPK